MNKELKEKLEKKVQEHGMSDLRKLAPIGDLGYANGWYPPFGDGKGIECQILDEAHKQGFKVIETWNNGRGDHKHECEELGLVYWVDSSG